MRLSIAAVGSRGDVQPYLALGLGLKKAGHQVQICADRLFENLVASVNLPFTPITATPADMMEENLSRHGGYVRLIGWLQKEFKPLAHQFFSDLESATREADAILYSTLAFPGYHVAEKHGIPRLGVYTVPITPTRRFQSPSAPPAPEWFPFKGAYNWWSFRLANQIFIKLIEPVVNECRREILGLSPLSSSFYNHLDVSRIPVVYGFSPILLPRPDDWGDWLQVSGHWFMDEQGNWQPHEELVHFLEGGEPPIYMGFGSMIDEQIKHITPIILEALKRTGQRAILLGGWGGLGKGDLPDTVLYIDSVPHDWLFPRVSAVIHHGGTGTTATGLRYGKPTVIVPFFADQPFWGDRIHRLGAGPKPIPFTRLNVNNLSQAIDEALTDLNIKRKAIELGEGLQREDGVGKAVHLIQEFLKTQH